ncbi:MarR family winged helix-turn-helix transcriptional regulator [Roseibium sp.]|uniref:MarR family winged helix-turn-helix transcriptional regulator n=1 Tax=Roseibium sp. TaxID=1936156 RepID=UPI003D0A3408
MTEKPFNLSAFLPYRLAVLSERISRRIAADYERTHGLTVAEWRVLVHLLRSGEVSVREIQTCVNLDKPRVSRAVARLEKAGLVRKVPGAADARLVAISLTGKGHGALADILPAAESVEARLLQSLSADEYENFCAVMEKLHGVLDADPQARPRSPMDTEGLGE